MNLAMFKLILPILIILTRESQAESANLSCVYYDGAWSYITETSLYYCAVQNPAIFDDKELIIEDIEGPHTSGKGHHDVTGFQLASASNLTKFPREIAINFKRLYAIHVSSSPLEEITQNDLMHFKRLKYLELYSNRIKVVREDTFDRNPHMEVILLYSNFIFVIDTRTFSDLVNLRVLLLATNNCKSLYDADTRPKVEVLVQLIEQGDCSFPFCKYMSTSVAREDHIEIGMFKNITVTMNENQKAVGKLEENLQTFQALFVNATQNFNTQLKALRTQIDAVGKANTKITLENKDIREDFEQLTKMVAHVISSAPQP
jgi:hypothetical protein